jgi:hypothetical protein
MVFRSRTGESYKKEAGLSGVFFKFMTINIFDKRGIYK